MAFGLYSNFGPDKMLLLHPFNTAHPIFASIYLFIVLVDLWALIELGFLRGTRGPNRFGPDPLPPEAHENPPGLAKV
jgi:uncharacterized membrane protein YhaH (DUF805 family)